jgi:hypothetical protein
MLLRRATKPRTTDRIAGASCTIDRMSGIAISI